MNKDIESNEMAFFGESEETRLLSGEIEMNLQLFADEPIPMKDIVDENDKPLFSTLDGTDAEGGDDEEPEDDEPDDDEVPDDPVFISRLLATDQNLPHTTIGEVVVRDLDGELYSVAVNKDGEAEESAFQIGADNIEDGAITGAKLEENTITSRELDMEELFADTALMNQMLTANIDAEGLFENEAFMEKLQEYTVMKAGDEMTGPLTLAGAPEDELQAATKQYVDEAVAGDMPGNAASATQLQTARAIGIGGKVTGTATAFDGTQDITINATAVDATTLGGIPASKYYNACSVTDQVATIEASREGMPLTVTARAVANQEGSGDPSPDNVRKIVGKSAVNVTRCGKNLIPGAKESITINGMTYTPNADGSLHADGSATEYAASDFAGAWLATDTVLILTPGTYTLKGTGVANFHCVLSRDGTDGYWQYADTVDNTFIVTEPFVRITRIFAQAHPGTVVDNVTVYPTLYKGQTAAPYEPYTGDTYTLTLPEMAYGMVGLETVLDCRNQTMTQFTTMSTMDGVTNGLKVTKLSKTGEDGYQAEMANDSVKQPSNSSIVPKLICSHGRTASSGAASTMNDWAASVTDAESSPNSPGLILKFPASSGITTIEAANSWLAQQLANGTPVQFLYESKESKDIAITAPIIPSLPGINIVYTDAGGNVTVIVGLNADSATKLQTARTIGIGGKVTGTATAFDGTRDITINATAVDATTLNGQSASYYATATQVDQNKPVYTTGALTAGGWTSMTGGYQQPLSVTGVTAAANCYVTASPAVSSFDAWCAASIRATAQGSGTLTFFCKTRPHEDIGVNIRIEVL